MCVRTVAIWNLVLLLATGLAAPPEAAAEVAAETLPPAAVASLEEIAAATPGLSVAVGVDAQVRWAHAVGLADLELSVPVQPETRFLVYSAAKHWTAAAAARLAERGRLPVHEPIGALMPELPEPLRSATPMQLARHQAGVRHYANDAEAVSSRHCGAVDEALPLFVNDPLLFAPGTDRAYSSWGYVLFSAVLERVAGSSFSALMEREVFETVGMESVVLADPYALIRDRATAYAKEKDAWRNLPGLDVTCKWGAGGFLATPTDLVRFYLGLFEGTVVGPAFLPLFLETDDDGLLRFGGRSAGGRSQVLADPKAGWVVALAANARAGEGDFASAALRLAETLGLRSR